MLTRHLLPACLIAAALHLASPAAAETLAIGGTGTSQATMRLLADALAKGRPDLTVEMPRSLGSTGGIKALLAGALDIATSGRPLTPAEAAEGAQQIAYARTPFMVVTSHPTFRESLTPADIVAIFTMQRTSWPDGTAIRIVLRPETDADTDYLKAHFPGIEPGLAAVRALERIPVAKTDQDNMDAAEAMPGSFAATSLAIVKGERRKVAALPIDGVAPTLENLDSGAYRYGKTLYLVTRVNPAEKVGAFIAFLRSPEGRSLLVEAGNLPFEE
jgi:phosphate transport system substrate-binding protein